MGTQELHWKLARFEDGIIDFQQVAGEGEHRASIAYAVCYVKSFAARRGLRLKVGGDDLGRIYLNGRLLHESPFSRSFGIDQETALGAGLEAGVNVLVFKVINRDSDWKAALRFTDEHDAQFQGLEFSTSPD